MLIRCPIVELRQYTMQPGRRDELISIFEEHFIESQEECGAWILGQFRVAGDPDRFVWMRGFTDMEARLQALQDFYGGPIWSRYREAANATMVDSSNVLLLRPAGAGAGFRLDAADRPSRWSSESPGGVVVASIHRLGGGTAVELACAFEEIVAPALRAGGAAPLASLTTEPSANNFPRLPVREDESVFAWFASFPSAESYAAHRAALADGAAWVSSIGPAIRAELRAPHEQLELVPTRRSLLRHSARPNLVTR